MCASVFMIGRCRNVWEIWMWGINALFLGRLGTAGIAVVRMWREEERRI